jgi:osmotically-inducible protein OsmY
MAELARDKTRAFVTSPEVRQDAKAVGSAIKNAGNAAVASVDDAAITASVTQALAKDGELNASRIEVQTRGGVVHLAGQAPSAAAKARAGKLAGAVQDVSAVDNALDVRAL